MARVQLLLVTAVCALACPSAAWAQAEQPPAADNAGEQEAATVGDIIVTANRRAENLQRVPISVSAFTGQTLDTLGIESVADLPNITPGLSLTRTIAGANSFLRAVGTTTAGYTTESPIAVYLDGIYLPNAAAAAFSFNNIERIEVLKGPQGTLYGRNTTGGLIHVITRDPGRSSALDVAASYGNYDTVKLDAYASVPLGDTLAANVSATYLNQGGGWGRNVLLGAEAYFLNDVGVQAKLQWRPSPRATVTLQGFYDRTRSDLNSYAIYPGSRGADGTTYLGEYRVSTREAPSVVQRQLLGSLKVRHDFGFATLSATTAYIDNRSPSRTPGPYPGNPVAGQAAITLFALQEAESFSQEINLSSQDSAARLQWIAGLFYYRDDTKVRSDVYARMTAIDLAPLGG